MDIWLHVFLKMKNGQKITGSGFWINFEVVFQSGIVVLQYFKVKTKISIKKEKVVFA